MKKLKKESQNISEKVPIRTSWPRWCATTTTIKKTKSQNSGYFRKGGNKDKLVPFNNNNSHPSFLSSRSTVTTEVQWYFFGDTEFVENRIETKQEAKLWFLVKRIVIARTLFSLFCLWRKCWRNQRWLSAMTRLLTENIWPATHFSGR